MKIIGTGSAFPSTIVTNQELVKKLGEKYSADWIEKNLGIRERRKASEEETSLTFAQEAVNSAIKNSGVDKSSIDLLIMSTSTPELQAPASACQVQNGTKLMNAKAFDVSAVCSGFLYALTTAAAYLKANFSKRAIIVAADTYSKITDWNSTDCAFFGDGAGAVVIENNITSETFNYDSELYTDGSCIDIFKIPFGGPFELDATSAYEKVLSTIPHCVDKLLHRNNMTTSDIDAVIPHQPSIRLLKALANKSSIPIEKFCLSMEKYGNTASATIPVTLHDALEKGRISAGDNVLFLTAGGGFTAGAAIHKLC